MGKLWNFFHRDKINQIVLDVVERCDQLECDIQGQSIDRGYARAKWSGKIHLETSNAIRRHGAKFDIHSLVASLVTEKLIQMAFQPITFDKKEVL